MSGPWVPGGVVAVSDQCSHRRIYRPRTDNCESRDQQGASCCQVSDLCESFHFGIPSPRGCRVIIPQDQLLNTVLFDGQKHKSNGPNDLVLLSFRLKRLLFSLVSCAVEQRHQRLKFVRRNYRAVSIDSAAEAVSLHRDIRAARESECFQKDILWGADDTGTGNRPAGSRRTTRNGIGTGSLNGQKSGQTTAFSGWFRIIPEEIRAPSLERTTSSNLS